MIHLKSSPSKLTAGEVSTMSCNICTMECCVKYISEYIELHCTEPHGILDVHNCYVYCIDLMMGQC